MRIRKTGPLLAGCLALAVDPGLALGQIIPRVRPTPAVDGGSPCTPGRRVAPGNVPMPPMINPVIFGRCGYSRGLTGFGPCYRPPVGVLVPGSGGRVVYPR